MADLVNELTLPFGEITAVPTGNGANTAVPAPLPSPGAGGNTQTTNYNVQANYGYQNESSLRDDIRLLQIMADA
jgi:hypothetical protein